MKTHYCTAYVTHKYKSENKLKRLRCKDAKKQHVNYLSEDFTRSPI